MSHRAKDYCQASSSGNLPWTDFFFFFFSLGNISHEIQAAILFLFPPQTGKAMSFISWSYMKFFFLYCLLYGMLGAGQDFDTHLHGTNETVILIFRQRVICQFFKCYLVMRGKVRNTLDMWIHIYIYTHICRTQATIWYLTNNTSVDTGWLNGSTKIGH